METETEIRHVNREPYEGYVLPLLFGELGPPAPLPVCGPLRLWVVCDNACPADVNEQPYNWWACVWAANENDAAYIAAAHYHGNGPVNEHTAKEFLPYVKEPVWKREFLDEIVNDYCPGYPCIERRAKIQRLAGWRWKGEHECDSCGLAANDIAEHRVCDDCRLCGECWAEDTENRQQCEEWGKCERVR